MPRHKRHFTYYYMGRKHVIFRGIYMRSMRVFQWQETLIPHREVFDR